MSKYWLNQKEGFMSRFILWCGLVVILAGGLALPGVYAQQGDQTISPFVNCVLDLGGGLYGAYFGYENPTNRDALMMRGPDNGLSADAPDAQQPPQRFRRGGEEAAFVVEFAAPGITWTLNGLTATATAAATPESPRCASDPAVRIEVDPAQTAQTIAGFGGNFVHYFSKTPGGAVYDPVAAYNVEHLRPTHLRVGLELYAWEPQNDDADSQHYAWDAFQDSGIVRDVFLFMQDQPGATILASIWRPADWMVENPDSDRSLVLAPGIEDEVIESITAWLVRARDDYGVTVDYVSFNESNLGVNVLFSDPAQYADLIARAGARFAAEGLPTKWALGDTSNAASALSFSAPIWDNAAARPYLGVLAFHSWDAQVGDALLGQIGAWAAERELDVWVTEAGFDSQAYQTPEVFETWAYALDLARIYSRVYAYARGSVAFYWQMMDDYRLVSPDGSTPYPAFYVLEQLRDIAPPGAEVVRASLVGVNVDVLAVRSGTGLTLHLTHTGDVPAVVRVSGLPDGVYEMVRASGAEPAGVAIDPVEVRGGSVILALSARSVSIVTTVFEE